MVEAQTSFLYYDVVPFKFQWRAANQGSNDVCVPKERTVRQ